MARYNNVGTAIFPGDIPWRNGKATDASDFWVDMEMTGLDPASSVIIEFASIITTTQFEPISHYEEVVYQPPAQLQNLDEWNTRTHTQSGLLGKVPNGKPLAQVETEVIKQVELHFSGEPAVLAGNSIHQDRKFIDLYMPRLAEKLSYRMIDVSSFKQIFSHCLGITFPKTSSHRALDDIEASINELRHYLRFVSPANAQPN